MNTNHTAPDTRIEQDLLGTLDLPADCLWGIHTERARCNFPARATPVPLRLIRAYARVKQACARANARRGALPPDRAAAIESACAAIAAGAHPDAFPLDGLQGGAGTSTNMNLNEVIANLALDALGAPRGDYARIDPLDHVNRHQSTNDTYPTALRVAAIEAIREAATGVQALQGALQNREQAFAAIVTIGRTEGMPAVPMTLGQIFSGMAEATARDRWRLFKCEERLRVVNLGGTAVGNGLGAPRAYIFDVIEQLRALTGFGLCRGENLAGETAFADAPVEVAGIVNAAAANLVKIARDLRRLHVEGDIRLPALQAGSSIMPGKVNPVACEYAIQSGLWILSMGALVAQCAAQGSLQIVETLPLLAYALLNGIDRLSVAATTLAGHVRTIEADPETCAKHLSACPGLATTLVPVIGYARATALVRQGELEGVTDWRSWLVRQVGESELSAALQPARLTRLGFVDHADNP